MTKFPITLGVKDTPFDFSEWNRHCLDILGRTIRMGEHITQQEWHKLGYIYAGGEIRELNWNDQFSE